METNVAAGLGVLSEQFEEGGRQGFGYDGIVKCGHRI